MEHGQKPEMEKNYGKPNGKEPPAGQGPNMAKYRFLRDLSIFSPFSGHFWAMSSWGLFSIWFSIFSPLPAFASPAGSQDKGQQDRESPRGKTSSERVSERTLGKISAMKTKSQKGTSQRFSEVLSETL